MQLTKRLGVPQWIEIYASIEASVPPIKRNGMGAAVLAGTAGGEEVLFLHGGVKGDDGIISCCCLLDYRDVLFSFMC
jgi:hypothetical protein